jgi:phosphatidylinositol glycan class V
MHIRLLVILTISARLATILLTYLLSNLPLFDSSPLISSPNASPLLRWDAFHFAHIAQSGYVHEYEWAFFPGTPLVMRLSGEVLRFLKGMGGIPPALVSWDDLLQGGALVAFMCDVHSTTTLYHLTLHHLRSPNLALIASILSLLPSSPATLRFAAYSEPFFTYFSYRGESLSRSFIPEKIIWYPTRHAIVYPVQMVRRIYLFRTSGRLQIKWDPP